MTNLTISVKENSMTKPEGPAQEPEACPSQHLPCGCEWEPCEEDPRGPIFWNRFNGVAQCHMCGQVYVVPATPASSQPVGAREWFMARRKMDAYISFDDMEEYAQFVARQQTAAKDAALVAVSNNATHDHYRCTRAIEHLQQRAEAAERERDSLREANARLAADLDAALKAGKDGQK